MYSLVSCISSIHRLVLYTINKVLVKNTHPPLTLSHVNLHQHILGTGGRGEVGTSCTGEEGVGVLLIWYILYGG